MQEMTCICCPIGCHLVVDDSDKNNIKVSGNTCPRGAKYGKDEVTCPLRTVTSVARVAGGQGNMVSVKTSQAIPKAQIFEALELLTNVVVTAPVAIGDVICKDILGLGIDFVATKNIDKKIQ
ncbi:MAG: DUF1667 domain-containing protein [Clostridia bacterium]